MVMKHEKKNQKSFVLPSLISSSGSSWISLACWVWNSRGAQTGLSLIGLIVLVSNRPVITCSVLYAIPDRCVQSIGPTQQCSALFWEWVGGSRRFHKGDNIWLELSKVKTSRKSKFLWNSWDNETEEENLMSKGRKLTWLSRSGVLEPGSLPCKSQ